MTDIGQGSRSAFVAPGAPRVAAAVAVPPLVATGGGVFAASFAESGGQAVAVGVSLAAYAVIAGLVLARIDAHHPHERFGTSNGITLARAGGACVLAGVAANAARLAEPSGAVLAWSVLATALVLLALDGVDGWLARRAGTASAFGARFDMEVDAFFVLVLSALALGLGKAGAWVLAIGLMRYAFVLAGYLVPRLARPLPESFRRKAVCVLQVLCLAILLAPPVEPPVSAALAAGALAALVWSFAVDLCWLVRRAR